MDEEMQEFVMEYGDNDNNGAHVFVEQMRILTLKEMEDADIEYEDSDIEIEDLDVTLNDEEREHAGDQEEEENRRSEENAGGDQGMADDAATQEGNDANSKASNDSSSKTQYNTAMAEAKNAGKESEETPGQALP